MKTIVLILDLDGVLITNPAWKADKMDVDGYSEFNKGCINNLNGLLAKFHFEIWLSSTRRIMKSLEEFNMIFELRNISLPITGFVPSYPNSRNRKDEVLSFTEEFGLSKFLIIDDDKSLNALLKDAKSKLILTDLHKGFDTEALNLAIERVNSLY